MSYVRPPHGGAGKDLPPLVFVHTTIKAGPSHMRYGMTNLSNIVAKTPAVGPLGDKKPEALQPRVKLVPPSEGAFGPKKPEPKVEAKASK